MSFRVLRSPLLSDRNCVFLTLETALKKGRVYEQNRRWVNYHVNENMNSARSAKMQWRPITTRRQQALATKAFPPSARPAISSWLGYRIPVGKPTPVCIPGTLGEQHSGHLLVLLQPAVRFKILQMYLKTHSNQDIKEIRLNFGNPVCLALFLWAWELPASQLFQLLPGFSCWSRGLQPQHCSACV